MQDDYVKLSSNQFLRLNPVFLESGMFKITHDVPQNFFDLHTSCTDVNVENEFDTDESFGDLYALIGVYYLKEIRTGYIVVLQRKIVTENNFQITCSMQLVKFGNHTNNKLGKRCTFADLRNKTDLNSAEIKKDLHLRLFNKTILIRPGNVGRQRSDDLDVAWSSRFLENRPSGVDISKVTKRKHAWILDPTTTNKVLEEASLEIYHEKLASNRQVKKLRSLEREGSISYFQTKDVKSMKNTINLREEAVSLVDGAFENQWSPEEFVKGFLAVQNKCTTEHQLAAVAASLLMDPSFRITDCTAVVNTKAIKEVSIDLDQVIIKCTLKLSSLKKTRAEFGNDIVGYERAFLEDAYMKLKEIVAYSENDTTTYSPNLVSSGQKCKGSSADSSSQRSKYVSLGTKGITGQVFNMSFKNCGKIGATLDQVFSASMTVIEFLLQSDDFRNEYSSQQFEIMKILWKTDHSGDFHVAGGLLFPILTLLLISYNSLEGIIACFESYGGKKRGVHHHWNFDQTSPIDIKNAISGLMKTEKCKIPFRMKKAFETIKDTWPLWTNNISLIWGIGCDAKGSNISDDDPSYLVCEPVRISEVDEFRNGATDKVFVNPSVNDSSLNLSAVTRFAARTDSKTDNSDSDSDSDKKPIRNRWFCAVRHRYHDRYVHFGQLCPFNLHSVTHKVKKGCNVRTGNMTLDDNRSLCRVQCYSPNLRALYGYNGVQKIGQKLLDIRSLINPIEKNANSHVNLEIANKNASEWIISAKDHINNISKNGGMARLELTFETDSFKDDSVIEKGVETLMKTFVEHTKVYSGKLVGNLAMISLLSFQGIFNALMLWFQPYQISDSPCWDTFGEVWNYLTYMAINFFSGKRTFETKAYYTPRLGYLFSRPFLNPSWTGINSAMRKTFVDQETFDNMKKLWYNRTEMIDEFHLGLKRLQSKTIQLNSEFETKFSAFKRLLSANCQSCKSDINEAIACSECKTITSVSESKNDSWLHHLCKPNENTRKNIKLNSKEFDAYVEGLAKSLSSSQQEAFEAIISSKQNCFLTGVAGSGKSFILKLLLPTLILSDGFSSILLTGTTNIAATNINGITLSKFMGLVVGESNDTMINCNNENQLDVAVVNHIKKLNEEKPSIIQNATLCKVLIIDEAGMCEKNQFHFLECFLRKVKNSTSPFGGVRIILIGDVLQLEPVGDAKNSSKTGGYFFEDVKFENFFVCYLRENHRQKDDKEFLEALNKVRVGDSSVLEYLNDNIFNMNVASFSTLEMAYKKLEKIKQTPDQWATIVKRAKFESLIIARNDPTDPDLVGQRKLDFQERLKKAPKNGFSDLVVCLEHNEREAYTDLRRENVEVVILEAADVTSSNYRAPDSISKKLDKKLERKLHAFIGMFCRVTYQTDNKYICSNTLVKIKDFTYSDEKTVQKITVETTSPDFQIVSVNIGRVTITEYVGKYEYKRTQFPLMSAVGLLPWSLQCLTISQNIFYDNSRSGSTLSCIKGLLYTVMSRVKLKEQFSFLHKVTEEEIRNGVNKKAKEFDDKYRLKSGQVLFNFNKLF